MAQTDDTFDMRAFLILSDLPAKGLGDVIQGMKPEDAVHLEAERAYLRGDFKSCRDALVGRGDPTAHNAIIFRGPPAVLAGAAISLGDVELFDDCWEALSQMGMDEPEGSQARAVIDLHRCAISLSLFDRSDLPEWFVSHEFGILPDQILPWAMYVFSKYLIVEKDYERLCGVAETTLSLLPRGSSEGLSSGYLKIMAALGNLGAGRTNDAERYLDLALDQLVPKGYLTPIAENLTALPGLMETRLVQRYPQAVEPARQQYHQNTKNWFIVHNHVLEAHVSTVLDTRETQVAMLAVRGLTNKQIAARMSFSVGTVKSVLQDVYAKLLVSNRRELEEYINF